MQNLSMYRLYRVLDESFAVLFHAIKSLDWRKSFIRTCGHETLDLSYTPEAQKYQYSYTFQVGT